MPERCPTWRSARGRPPATNERRKEVMTVGRSLRIGARSARMRISARRASAPSSRSSMSGNLEGISVLRA
jgi:hypothetical protein